MREGASKNTSVRRSAASARSARERSPAFRGKNPSNVKRSVGSPATARAVMTALGPGIALTVTPRSAASCTTRNPGSETVGMPASLTSMISSCSARSTIHEARSRSLWSCSAMSSGRASMPSRRSSCAVCLVSSAAMASALSNASRRRGEASPRFPIGVAASQSMSQCYARRGRGRLPGVA